MSFSHLLSSFGELPGTLAAFLLVDRLGRRKTQACGLLSFAVFMGLASFLPKNIGLAALVAARASVNTCYVVTWLYTPEVYPTSIRATGFAAASAFSRLGGILMPFAVSSLSASVSLWVFATVGSLGAVAAYNLKVETTGKGLDEEYVDETLSGSFDTVVVPLTLT